VVIQPQVLQLRRLLIGEAGRLPKLSRAYYEGAPERTLATLAACFQHLGERGLLRVDDPRIAANHFAFLILGMSLDRAMFRGTDKTLAAADLERLATPEFACSSRLTAKPDHRRSARCPRVPAAPGFGFQFGSGLVPKRTYLASGKRAAR